MVDLWNNASIGLFDFLLGWMLHLPSDVVIVALALITAGLMAIVRPFTTNQDRLERVYFDQCRLKELTREAKKKGDRAAVLRYRTTGNLLSMRKLTAEFKPLIVVLVPVCMLATWAMDRVGYHPPRADEPIEVTFYAQTPDGSSIQTAAGEAMHLMPLSRRGVQATSGWVQKIVLKEIEPNWWDNLLVKVHLADPPKLDAAGNRQDAKHDALAIWTLEGKAQAVPYPLTFRFRDQTVTRELLIGQTTYSPPWVTSPEGYVTHTNLREVQFLGFVPGLGEWLPAWVVGYVIVVIPLVWAVKSVLKIY